MSRVQIGTDALTVTIVPESGARIAQLSDRVGRSWLVEPRRAEPSYPADVTSNRVRFSDGTRGGWDECVPSVSATRTVADHGDFWFRPWRPVTLDDRTATFAGPDFGQPLRVAKTVSVAVDRPTVRIELTASNSGEQAYPFIYSAHPLFRWPATATLDVPGCGEVRRAFGSSGRSVAVGAPIPRHGSAENYKVFARWGGTARLSFAGVQGLLMVSVPATDPATRWLGVCVNRDSWPADQPGESWIALEPTSSPTDSLDEAVLRGEALRLEPDESRTWVVDVTIEDAA